MIKANELRLNNWVNISGSYIQLAGEKFLYILEQDGMFTRCDGISLTPEILEKAGFESTGDGYFLFPLTMERYEDYYTLENYDIYIKHVHQLQNLYFALTGSELEINLTKVDTPAQLQ